MLRVTLTDVFCKQRYILAKSKDSVLGWLGNLFLAKVASITTETTYIINSVKVKNKSEHISVIILSIPSIEINIDRPMSEIVVARKLRYLLDLFLYIQTHIYVRKKITPNLTKTFV